MDHRIRADALVRATLSLRDAGLRAQYLANAARTWPTDALARALDALCERAEQAESAAREALVAVVEALNGEGMESIVAALREQAESESLLALERLVRHPSRGLRSSSPPPPVDSVPIRNDSPRPAGRILTLGERKWLARRPDRETMQRLLQDPHPDVIRRCLVNPRLTEDDVVRFAAKRPGREDLLAEVARSGWVRCPRVRLSLVLNPATPTEIAMRIAGLLMKPELELVAQSPAVNASIRAVCLEHLKRRPPVGSSFQSEKVH